MTDYAPNYTARLRVRYHAGGRNHSQTWRIFGTPDSTELAAAITNVNDFYNLQQVYMFDDWVLLSAEYANINDNVFLPADGIVIPTGDVPFTSDDRGSTAASISYVGRTIAGLRAIIYQYGATFQPGSVVGNANDFRVYSAENPDVAAAIANLNLATSLVGNDGNPIVWYPYINNKYNDYWTRKVRQGA